MGQPAEVAFRSRIVGEGVEAPDQLLANPLNWRRHPRAQQEALEGMLRAVGWVQRVIVNRRTGHLVDGHLRVEVALRRGEPAVPVLYVDLTEEEERIVLAAIDPIGGLAEADDAALDALLQGLESGDAALDAFLDSLRAVDAVEPEPGLTEDDEAPELQPDAVTRPGDLWQLGPHRLLCGDSTSAADVQRLAAGRAVDLWLTDPPYNVAYEGGTKDRLTIKNDAMGDEQFRVFLRDACMAADGVMRPGAVFYVWHADTEGYNFRGAVRDAGWQARQCLIWRKNSIVMGRQDYHWQHEPCLYGWKGGAGHLWAADRRQSTVLDFDRPTRSAQHPTMKPVALIAYLMLNNTEPGDAVLDSFGGSGSTLIAAQKHGRLALLMELDPHYCDVIVRRWQAYTGKAATREADGATFAGAELARAPA